MLSLKCRFSQALDDVISERLHCLFAILNAQFASKKHQRMAGQSLKVTECFIRDHKSLKRRTLRLWRTHQRYTSEENVCIWPQSKTIWN